MAADGASDEVVLVWSDAPIEEAEQPPTLTPESSDDVVAIEPSVELATASAPSAKAEADFAPEPEVVEEEQVEPFVESGQQLPQGQRSDDEEDIVIIFLRPPIEAPEKLEELEVIDDGDEIEGDLVAALPAATTLIRAFQYPAVGARIGVLHEYSADDQNPELAEAIPADSVESRTNDGDPNKDFFVDLPGVSRSPLFGEIQDLLKNDVIEVYTIGQIKRLSETDSESVQFDDGVYRITEDAVEDASAGGGQDRDFTSLVESVVSAGKSESIGIESILSSSEGDANLPADLFSGGIIEDYFQDGLHSRDRSGASKILDEGIDFDTFLRNVSSGLSSDLKSVMKFSRPFQALSAAVLGAEEGGLVVRDSIGFEESIIGRLCFRSTSAVYKAFFENRCLLYVKERATGIEDLDTAFKSANVRYFAGSIYLPIVLRSMPAYIFLGIRSRIDDVFNSLKVALDY